MYVIMLECRPVFRDYCEVDIGATLEHVGYRAYQDIDYFCLNVFKTFTGFII